ncbi:Hypothetical predicted protein [Xyrichtys novacula]|uniref:Uncharacterized protein n=1 Tax=Xyrichtys novacula TaxID=13765 RepID=A0AAV1G4V8_XYRNO|nr:Hypothetical predicted protein [Xyrichtys novacula]
MTEASLLTQECCTSQEGGVTSATFATHQQAGRSLLHSQDYNLSSQGKKAEAGNKLGQIFTSTVQETDLQRERGSERSLNVEILQETGPEFPLFARPTSGIKLCTQAEEEISNPGRSVCRGCRDQEYRKTQHCEHPAL